jgi:hypothetical protein
MHIPWVMQQRMSRLEPVLALHRDVELQHQRASSQTSAAFLNPDSAMRCL